jgi:4-hydroxybenzoate polyprenyltransferase
MSTATETGATETGATETGTTEPGHTDIRASGWVARLPASWRPYVLLGRFDRPIGAWLLFLPGLWSILLAGVPWARSAWLIALFLVGAFVMRAAGCVVNDLWDRDMDRRVTRTAGRPLASGAISVKAALVFMAAMSLIGLWILTRLPVLAQALGVGSLLLVALYPAAKRVTWWPQLMLGFTFGWGAPMGYAAARGTLPPAALCLYLAAILWIVGYDTVYALQDHEDDALVGIRSTARLFGAASRWLVLGCYASTLLALLATGLLAGLGPWFYPALLLPAVLLAWQVVRLDPQNPARCLALFKFNRETGLAIALAILAGML